MEIDTRKRKIEASSLPRLKKIFRNMADDAKNLYIKNGSINSSELAKNYYPEFLKEVRDTMRRAFKEFNSDLRDRFKLKIDDSSLRAAATFFIANESEKQAQFITETNASQIAEALLQEIVKFSNRKALPEWIIIAQNLKVNLLDKSEARSDLIAAQVVGLTESWTRQQEAELVNGGELANGKKIALKKTWIARLDTKTRPAHVAADFQQVGLSESFYVDGESLKYPRDPNGSASNTINCRCIVSYENFGS